MTARVSSIEFISPETELDASADNADVQVRLEDGSLSSFVASTPDQPSAWMRNNNAGFSFGTPLLFVRSLDRETVGEAVSAMASEMSGYWLRYYNSLGDLSSIANTLRGPRRKEARPK